ncbi:MAG: hypothetical protein HFJ41_04660 [Clostridia bacterium]|nr:hypothetical protein [Clostridia bacterium]
MDLKWYYSAENDGTTNAVATLYKANGCPVLHVFKSKDAYFSRPYGEYAQHIDRIKVPYEDANFFVDKQKAIIAEGEKEISKIKYACALFESNFKMQVNTILSLFA